ncbi:MAG TPA: PQQ-binding-like beta-propeller repeat protein [Streptosporangiaceae bacterium]|nr:PQQ-binding-like beta-propeller repeat protein [Streptosporangiaceae bacterium]
MRRSLHVAVRRTAAAVVAAGCAVGLAVGLVAGSGPAAAVGPGDWPAYLGGPAHTSRSAGTAITPANAPSLTQKWHFDIPYVSSPVVADGSVFLGSFAGYFYKINAVTGIRQKKIFLGFQPALTCPKFGFASTATVARDPSTGQDTVYVAAPDGYLYALNATTLTQVWRSPIAIPSKTVSDYFSWSSPTVSHGKIYVGIASNCDTPLVRGGVAAFNQATGNRTATFYTVPAGQVGGSVWSTVAVDGSGNVYATTGNGPAGAQRYQTIDILKLSPALKLLAKFAVPPAEVTGDGDFGGSPTLFTAMINGTSTPMVGACNKNGIFYALQRSTMAKVWQTRIGVKSSDKVMGQCQSAAAFDGTWLYMAGPGVTIGGTAFRGSVARLDPATGVITWQTGLPNGVLTSPSIDGAGVIAAGTYDNSGVPNETYLFDASDGALLAQLDQGNDFPQSAFANGWLYTASSTGLYAWGP